MEDTIQHITVMEMMNFTGMHCKLDYPMLIAVAFSPVFFSECFLGFTSLYPDRFLSRLTIINVFSIQFFHQYSLKGLTVR